MRILMSLERPRPETQFCRWGLMPGLPPAPNCKNDVPVQRRSDRPRPGAHQQSPYDMNSPRHGEPPGQYLQFLVPRHSLATGRAAVQLTVFHVLLSMRPRTRETRSPQMPTLRASDPPAPTVQGRVTDLSIRISVGPGQAQPEDQTRPGARPNTPSSVSATVPGDKRPAGGSP